MPRKKLIRTSQFPYHIVTRANHKWWFHVPMEKVWQIFLDCLHHANTKHPIEFHGAICMSNHYHMVIRTPDANIDSFMFEFNMHFSKQIRQESKLINRMLGKRYFWSIIDNQSYYSQVMKYLFLNPVRSAITQTVEEYQFSSLFHQLHEISFPTSIRPYSDFSSPQALKWINSGHTKEQKESIDIGIKKTRFKYGHIKGKRVSPKFDEQK